MPQSLRRATSQALIGLALTAGAAFAASTAPNAAPDPDATLRAQNALFESFRCTLSLLTLQPAEAEKFCGKTIDLLPDSPIGYKFRGFAYLLEHRFERAEIDFREAVRLDSEDPDNQAGLGQAMSGQGRFGEAVDRFSIALNKSPRDARYLAARCWARAGQGADFKKALADCNLALKYAPHSAVAYDDRALVYLRLGDNGKALGDYTKSLGIQPDRSTALFGRGIAEWHLGERALARTDLSLARDVDPDIDDTFILVGVLPQACRDGQASCPLPSDLRPSQKPPRFYSVSFRMERAKGLILQP